MSVEWLIIIYNVSDGWLSALVFIDSFTRAGLNGIKMQSF